MDIKYISTAGSDTTGDGSLGNPWATLGYAVTGSRMAVGDTLTLLTNSVLPNNVTMALAAGSGETTINLNGFTLTTSVATTNTLRPVAGTMVFTNGLISIDHAVSLGILRHYVSAHIKFVDVELRGKGNLAGVVYENAAVNTELTLKDSFFDLPGWVLYAGAKSSGSLAINLDNSVLVKAKKLWTGSGAFAVTVRSNSRCVFHGTGETAISGALITIPDDTAVPDKSSWDIDLHGHIFIQGDGQTSGTNIVYAGNALSGKGNWRDVFEAKFKNNIFFNYNLDTYSENQAYAQNYFDRCFQGITDIFDIDHTNMWRPPYASEPTERAEYADVQTWTQQEVVSAALVGDSIAWGTGSTDGALGSAYQMGQLLAPASSVNRDQSGMPGLGIDGLRWWVDRMLCKYPAKYVAVLIGINNAKFGGTYSSLTDQQLADHAAHVLSIIEARGASPIWIGLGPDVGGSVTRANAINSAMQTHCATHGWVYLPWIDEMVKNASWQTAYFASISTNLHPNDAGALLIGEVAERAVRFVRDGQAWGMRSSFDGTMPALALADTAPGDLRSVQVWKKVASAKEIEKY